MSHSLAKKTQGPAGTTVLPPTSRFNLGLPRLDFARDPLQELQLDHWRIREALRRGAGSIEIFFLLTRSRQSLQSKAKPAGPAPSLWGGTGPILADPELEYQSGVMPLIAEAEMSYREEMRHEFDRLPAEVQQAFGFEGGTPFYHYLRIRPAYYNAGYDDPAGTIFMKMRSASLAGRKVVSPGVHEMLAKQLPQAEALLNQWQPGLAVEIGRLIRSVGGFVPRYIAQRQGQKKPPVLSNHALGLAVDIDPAGNPHIKDRDVIAILNEIAKESGIDYGKSIVERGNLPAEDWAAQTHNRAQMASTLIKAWLTKYLGVFEAQEERSKLEQKIAHAKTAAQKEQAFDKLSGGDASNAMTPALSPAEQDAVEKIKTLRKYHPMSEIKIWAANGIQTIPQVLAVALIKAGLRWGQSYRETKDAMHFELVDDKGRAVVRPESRPRMVDELFPVAGTGAPVKQAAGQAVKPKAH